VSVSPHVQSAHRVRFDWGLTGARLTASGSTIVVVVDVLSFSTTVSVAMDSAVEVFPCPWGDERAKTVARENGATLAVGRSAAREGPGVSLSPASVRRAVGLTKLVLPSPNGSTISLALSEAGTTVVPACLRNRSAVVRWLADALGADPSASLTVIAAGERWPDGTLRPCLEDFLGAGAVLAGISALGFGDLSPEAATAADAWQATPNLNTLRRCASAVELSEQGFGHDVDIALEDDQSDHVPLLVDSRFVRASRA